MSLITPYQMEVIQHLPELPILDADQIDASVSGSIFHLIQTILGLRADAPYHKTFLSGNPRLSSGG